MRSQCCHVTGERTVLSVERYPGLVIGAAAVLIEVAVELQVIMTERRSGTAIGRKVALGFRADVPRRRHSPAWHCSRLSVTPLRLVAPC